MFDTLNCYVMEEGIFLVILGILAAAVIVYVFYLFIRPLARALPAAFKKPSAIEVKIGERAVKVKGPVTALIISLFGVVFVVAIGYGLWSLYDYLDGRFAVNIDANNSPTLERLREDLLSSTRTRVTVIVEPSVKDVRIQGRFDGKCVTDVILAICRAKHETLECSRSVFDRSITIGSAAASKHGK